MGERRSCLTRIEYFPNASFFRIKSNEIIARGVDNRVNVTSTFELKRVDVPTSGNETKQRGNKEIMRRRDIERSSKFMESNPREETSIRLAVAAPV